MWIGSFVCYGEGEGGCFFCVFFLVLNKNDKTLKKNRNVNSGGDLFLWFTPEMPLS